MFYKKLLMLLIGSALSASAAYAEVEISSEFSTQLNATERVGERDTFIGLLRIYMVEPYSRWSDNIPTYNGFLCFVPETSVVLFDNEIQTIDFAWDAALTEFPDVDPDNLKIMAALFNSESPGTGYSEPPDGHPFTIYPSDATAWAGVSEHEDNQITESFTHTVFLELGTENDN